MSEQFHLAQINIAWARAPLDHPVMKGFVDRLDAINALADRSPGFVWRLQTEEGDATAINAFGDGRIIVNMSVWTSLAALKDYVYGSGHLEVLKQKKSWFEKLSRPSLALWWMPAEKLPTIDDGKAALALLELNGPTARSFTFARPFAAPQPSFS